MKELTKFCARCKKEQDIIEILRDPPRETFKMTCGHEFIALTISEAVGVSDQIFLKHFDSSHKLKTRNKTKKANKSGRPAKDLIVIDRERQILIHKVWEKNEDGTLELVHCEEKPFKKKSK